MSAKSLAWEAARDAGVREDDSSRGATVLRRSIYPTPEVVVSRAWARHVPRTLQFVWSLRQESNLYLALRRRPFYPLNYGGPQALSRANGGVRAPREMCIFPISAEKLTAQFQRQVQMTSSALSSPVCARSVKRRATR